MEIKDYSNELEFVPEFYGTDFNKSELSTQLQILTSNIRMEMPSCETVGLPEIVTFVRKLSKGQRVFFRHVP